MKLNKFTVVLAVLLISMMAIGAVSADSVDDSDVVAINEDIGEVQESVEPTEIAEDVSAVDSAEDLSIEETPDDLSVPETTDDVVNEEESSAVLTEGETSYDLDDYTYSTYFNDDGTATAKINESSDYTLNVGTLNNKDITIAYGSHINIVGKDGAGVINNGTITIGDGLGGAGSITISGLTFTNTNKDAIHITQFSTDITIDNNNFDLTYDSTYYDSPAAIVSNGYLYDVEITNNNVKMETAAGYNYGFTFWNFVPVPGSIYWDPGIGNAEQLYVANNVFNMTSTASSGMVEALYIDSVINSVFDNNTIHISSGVGVVNYGITVVDSCAFYAMMAQFDDEYSGGYSPYNITIKNNDVNIESGDLSYGITVISWFNETYTWDEEGDAVPERIIADMVISNNKVTMDSEKGAIGIGVQTNDVEITDNTVTVNANPFVLNTTSADPTFGNESYAIFVNNFYDYFGYYSNTTVANNIITTTVPGIYIKTKESSAEPIVVENNEQTIFIDDDNYVLFFNDDGTPNDFISPDGDYTLLIDTLNNKDIKILSGENIYIFAKEGAGVINNGTITIGNGIDAINAAQVSGLTFNNVNKDGIAVMENAQSIAIAENNFNLTYDSNYYNSPMAIVTHGYVNGVDIVGNKIYMLTEAIYSYGIDLTIYLPNWAVGKDSGTNFYVANNDINILSTVNPSPYTAMVEGMYLDSINNAVIKNNTVNVKTVNAGVANYGIALADSTGYTYGVGSSPYNITIEGNTVVLDSNDMAYGITAMSSFPVGDISKNIAISGNDVNILSTSGAIGIGAQTSDALITLNTVTLTADTNNPPQCYPDPIFGSESCGIFIDNYFTDGDDIRIYSNNNVKDNQIFTNVEAIKVAKTVEEEAGVAPLVIEENEVKNSVFIDDSNYDTYFNTNGTIKEGAAINPNDVLLLGDLTGKKLIIDIPLTINAVPNTKLVNTALKITTGADNTVVDGLTMEFINLKFGAITLEEVNNVEIANNKIIVPSTTQTVYGLVINSGVNGCNNISIHNNLFNITGGKYVYGIDIWQDYSLENKHNNIMIFENEFFVTGTGGKMTEAIYVSNCNEVTIDGNNINVGCNGPAYGIGTNYLDGAVIANNHITVGSDNMAYGITATTSGSDLIVRANEINVIGIGAVGVGINNQTGATIEDNTIVIDGGDYTSITVSDSLGTANAGILVGEGNENVELSGNDVTEVSSVRLDTAIDVSDVTVTAAPSGNGNLEITLKTVSGMVLANQNVKVVFDNQVLELTTDANGVAVLPFALNKGGTYNVDIFYLGDDDYRGSDASATITINKIATKTTSAAKTYLTTASSKTLTATLTDANGKAIANKAIVFTVNGKTYKATTNANGVATVKLALTAAKTYTVSIKFAGDGVYAASTASAKVTLNKEKTKLTSAAKTFLATAKTKKLTATLKDAKGKVIAKKAVTFTVNGKSYKATTNAKGVATVKLALKAAKTYTVSIKFAGDSVYAASTKSVKVKLNKEKTKITAPKKTFKKAKKVKKVVITLKNSKGKAIAKKKLTLIVNKKKLTAKTNKKGKASFKVKNLKKKGTFKYTAKFAGDSQYKAVKKNGKIKVK